MSASDEASWRFPPPLAKKSNQQWISVDGCCLIGQMIDKTCLWLDVMIMVISIRQNVEWPGIEPRWSWSAASRFWWRLSKRHRKSVEANEQAITNTMTNTKQEGYTFAREQLWLFAVCSLWYRNQCTSCWYATRALIHKWRPACAVFANRHRIEADEWLYSRISPLCRNVSTGNMIGDGIKHDAIRI